MQYYKTRWIIIVLKDTCYLHRANIIILTLMNFSNMYVE